MLDPLERWRAAHGERDTPDYAGFLTFGAAPATQDPAELSSPTVLERASARARSVRDLGIGEVVRRAVAAVGSGPAYVSVDVDVLDPAFAPGTGTPEPGGMTAADLPRGGAGGRGGAGRGRRGRRRGDPDRRRLRGRDCPRRGGVVRELLTGIAVRRSRDG